MEAAHEFENATLFDTVTRLGLHPHVPFQNAIKLSHYVAIYVPSTNGTNVASQDLIDWYVGQTVKDLEDLFDATTRMPGIGTWQGIKENVTIVKSFSNSIQDHLEAIETIALKIKQGMQQSTVALEMDNQLYIV